MSIEHLDGRTISVAEAAAPMPTVKYMVWAWTKLCGWQLKGEFDDGMEAATLANDLGELGWGHVRIVTVVLR